MASLRKQYQNRVEVSSDKDAPPVTSMPQESAAQPPPVADKQSPEPFEPEKKDPVEVSALQRRLREMDQAEALQHEAANVQQRRADPLEQFLQSIPKAASDWLRAHPEYMHDRDKNALLQSHHHGAVRETGEEFTPRYIEALERRLGLRPEPSRAEVTASRPAPTVRQPAVPMSAPVHRNPPSLSTGRPTQSTQLTREEQEIARASGISEEEYRAGKRRMLQEKAAGLHQDGR